MSKGLIIPCFFRACLRTGIGAVALTGMVLSSRAQTVADAPSFEVASIKPVLRDATHRFDPSHYGPHINSARVSYWGMTAGDLMAYAYGVDSFGVAGEDHRNAAHYDVEARLPEGTGPKDDKKMLQALLKERFKLMFHVEKRDLEIYALLVGKRGQKLTPAVPDPVVPASAELANAESGQTSGRPIGSSKPGKQTVTFDAENRVQHWEQSKTTMADLAQMLSICIDSTMHKVVDETGAKGYYQVKYDCPLPIRRAPTTDSAGLVQPEVDNAYALTRSLDAMGLVLEKRKVAMDFYVIDHMEQPSEN